MFLILRKSLKHTNNKTEEKNILISSDWRCHAVRRGISVVRVSWTKKCKIIEGGWGGIKNLKPGLINNGAFYSGTALLWET